MGIPQGRNRQIKRMLETVGAHVTALHRTKFAGITLGLFNYISRVSYS